MEIKEYESLDEMFEDIKKDLEAADTAAKDWQKELRVGDYVYREAQGLAIYGEILDPLHYWIEKGIRTIADATCRLDAEGRAEYAYEAEQATKLGNHRYGRWYSAACPEGEYGSAHVATVWEKISRGVFERAGTAGWPRLPGASAGGTP